MAALDEEKRAWQNNDQQAAVHSTVTSEPVAEEPLERVATEKELNQETQLDPERGLQRPELDRSRSTWTESSAVTETKSVPQSIKRRKWYTTANPLRWGKIEPVPKERQVSREYGAGFFSKLTFQWMAPIMNVSREYKNRLAYMC